MAMAGIPEKREPQAMQNSMAYIVPETGNPILDPRRK